MEVDVIFKIVIRGFHGNMQLDILRNSGNIFSGFEFETTNIIFYTYPNSTTELY